MAKPDDQTVDFSSQIQVTGRSGLSAAAGYERQIAENWSQIGNEFRSFMLDELKARNIEDGIALANQIQYDEKTVEADVDGKKLSVTMPSLIAPEGKIVGQSGLDAYKKIAAKTYVAELENDFTTITETEANIAEDQKLTMQEFTANVTDKHNIIYDNLPPDIVNAIRPDIEKQIIQRAARVQNQYLAFQNANQQEAYQNLSIDYKNKITNLSNIGDAKTARMQQEQYFKHLEDGLELGNIKGLTREFIQQERARVNGEVSFRLMLSQFSVKELDSRNLNHIRSEINNLTTLRDMLTPVPGMDKGQLVNPYTQETLDISPDLIKEMIADPQVAERIATDLNVRLRHFSGLIENVDSGLESLEIANSLISSRDANIQHEKLTEAKMKKITPDTVGYGALVKDYNKKYRKNLSRQDSLTNQEFQIILMTDYGVAAPTFIKTMTANLNAMDVEYLKVMYDSGILSKLKNHKVTGKGGRASYVNSFEKYFGDLADNFTRLTRALEQGEDIQEIARIHTMVKGGDAMTTTELEAYLKQQGSGLPTNRDEIYGTALASYQSQFPGVDIDRARAYSDKLLRQLQSDPLTRSLYATGNFNIDDDIYDRERTREYEYGIVKDGYIFNASGIDSHRAGHQEMYIARHKNIQQFALPPVINGEFDYTKEWNLDYMADFIRMHMANDPNTNWNTVFKGDIGGYIKDEWRQGGKIKVVPVDTNQKYPTYQLVHLNENGSPTYVTDASFQPVEIKIGDIFQPAYKNIVLNEDFRKFMLERTNRGFDGKVTELEQPDIDSLWYKIGRETNQLYKSIDILPDENWTLGETAVAGGAGIALPTMSNALSSAKNLISKGVKSVTGKGPKINLSKEAKKAVDIVKGKGTSRVPWLARAGLAITFYLGTTLYSREIEQFQQGFSVPPYSINDMQNHMRFKRETDLYPTQLPKWAIDAFDPDIETYKFTEDYVDEMADVYYPSGGEGTMMLSAEIHPETKQWIVYPNIRVVDGKRVLLSREDGLQEALDKNDFIPFGDADDPIAQKKAINMSKNYGKEVDWWRKNPNLEWWVNGVDIDK